MGLRTLLVFGGSGDLARRYLLPAVAELDASGLISAELDVVGVDRVEMDHDAFREMARQAVIDHGRDVDDVHREAFCDRLRYVRADVTDPSDIGPLIRAAAGPIAVYLALPNAVFGPAISALAEVDPLRSTRLVVEKPFGTSREDARRLNAMIAASFSEQHVYRVDHFLAKPTLLDILGVRFANRLFEGAWSREHIASVDITWDETGHIGERAGYYDHAGALVDMIQNHLLQILTLVAMEPPTSFERRALQRAKAELLARVSPPSRCQLAELTRRARYTAGDVAGVRVIAYEDAQGVDPARATETLAEVTFEIDGPRWAGVPFTLRTGKALAHDRREVTVTFRSPTTELFEPRQTPSGLLIKLDPDEMVLSLSVNGAGDPSALEGRDLVAALSPPSLRTYSLVLLDLIGGDSTLTVGPDEAEESWRVVEPVLEAWRHGDVDLEEYPAGSGGP